MFNQWYNIYLWFNYNILISIRTTIIMSIFQRTLPNRGHHLDSQITEYLKFIFTEVASRHEHAGQRSHFNCELRCGERCWRLIHDRCSPRSAPSGNQGNQTHVEQAIFVEIHALIDVKLKQSYISAQRPVSWLVQAILFYLLTRK